MSKTQVSDLFTYAEWVMSCAKEVRPFIADHKALSNLIAQLAYDYNDTLVDVQLTKRRRYGRFLATQKHDDGADHEWTFKIQTDSAFPHALFSVDFDLRPGRPTTRPEYDGVLGKIQSVYWVDNCAQLTETSVQLKSGDHVTCLLHVDTDGRLAVVEHDYYTVSWRINDHPPCKPQFAGEITQAPRLIIDLALENRIEVVCVRHGQRRVQEEQRTRVVIRSKRAS